MNANCLYFGFGSLLKLKAVTGEFYECYTEDMIQCSVVRSDATLIKLGLSTGP